MRDVTGVLIPTGQLTPDEIVQIVRSRPYGACFLRIQQLANVNLTQIEVQDAQRGFPCEDPELVGLLSQKGRATFVHLNHDAKQAMLHAFAAGKPVKDGITTEPGDAFETELMTAVGVRSEAITGADDGSRLGIGIAASNTMAILPARPLRIPVGTPTGLGSFVFHDRAGGLDEGGERLAFIAFDSAQAERAYFDQPADALKARIEQAPEGVFGPLEGARAEVLQALGAIGKKTVREAGLREVRALELCAMGSSFAFCAGESLDYWNERVLPIFSLSDQEAVIEPSEIEELEDAESILHAMVEVLPYKAPPGGEGGMVPMIADRELGPLAPWARQETEYRGSIFTLKHERLLGEVRKLNGQNLGQMITRFEKAWYRAERPGQPEGDAMEQWRRAKQETGQNDMNRFATAWAELRALLEIAQANQLTVGLVFYG
jgi:hypothetical protein